MDQQKNLKCQVTVEHSAKAILSGRVLATPRYQTSREPAVLLHRRANRTFRLTPEYVDNRHIEKLSVAKCKAIGLRTYLEIVLPKNRLLGDLRAAKESLA